MRKDLKKYSIYLLLVSLFIVQNNYSQSENSPWVIGLGANVIGFYPTNIPNSSIDDDYSSDRWNFGGPQILVTRYLVKNLSVDGLLTFNQITKFGDIQLEKSPYIGADINFRYSFIDTTKDFTIFVLAGLGYTSFNPETVWIGGTPIKFGSGATFNIGGGANYWFSNTFGLNFETLYKFSASDKLAPHLYCGLSLVFRVNSGESAGWRNCQK